MVNAVNMILAMSALFLLLLALGAKVHTQLLALPLAVGILMLFTFGIGLIFMVVNTYFRDLQHVLDVMLRLLYFLSPIFWDPGEMRGKNAAFDWVIKLNPLTHLLGLFHKIFCFGMWPNVQDWSICLALGAGTFAVGYMIYKYYEDKLIFRI